MPQEPILLGFTQDNSNRSLDKLWSKNVFNSTFPIALAQYMKAKGLKAKYIKLRADLKTEVCEISIDELFGTQGLADNEIYFDFESRYEPYNQLLPLELPLTDKDKIDLVVRKKSNMDPKSALEIKLTVIPDKSTAGKPREQQGSELVCRPVTTKYCALGIFEGLSHTERGEVYDLIKTEYKAIHDWNNPDDMDQAGQHLLRLKSRFDEFEQKYYTKQKPLILQPIWKTEGQTPQIDKDNAFDIFVWSDYAYTRLFLERNFIEKKKGKKELTRMARCMIRVAGYLYEAGHSRDGRADINSIFAKYTAKKQSDKDMSAPASITRLFMTQNASPDENCLLEPRISRSELLKIIKNGGQKRLMPERRLDQSIYFTFSKIKRGP